MVAVHAGREGSPNCQSSSASKPQRIVLSGTVKADIHARVGCAKSRPSTELSSDPTCSYAGKLKQGLSRRFDLLHIMEKVPIDCRSCVLSLTTGAARVSAKTCPCCRAALSGCCRSKASLQYGQRREWQTMPPARGVSQWSSIPAEFAYMQSRYGVLQRTSSIERSQLA